MIVLEMLVLSLSGLEELAESLGEIIQIINYFLSKISLSSTAIGPSPHLFALPFFQKLLTELLSHHHPEAAVSNDLTVSFEVA